MARAHFKRRGNTSECAGGQTIGKKKQVDKNDIYQSCKKRCIEADIFGAKLKRVAGDRHQWRGDIKMLHDQQSAEIPDKT